MDERDAPMEIGFDVALAIKVGDGVLAIRMERGDPAGTFRVRRGANSYEVAHAAEEQLRPPPLANPEDWADLSDTGVQVKITSRMPLRVGVRRLEDVTD